MTAGPRVPGPALPAVEGATDASTPVVLARYGEL